MPSMDDHKSLAAADKRKKNISKRRQYGTAINGNMVEYVQQTVSGAANTSLTIFGDILTTFAKNVLLISF